MAVSMTKAITLGTITPVTSKPSACAISLARMKAARETGLDNTQAAVPDRFSSMTASCPMMVAPIASEIRPRVRNTIVLDVRGDAAGGHLTLGRREQQHRQDAVQDRHPDDGLHQPAARAPPLAGFFAQEIGEAARQPSRTGSSTLLRTWLLPSTMLRKTSSRSYFLRPNSVTRTCASDSTRRSNCCFGCRFVGDGHLPGAVCPGVTLNAGDPRLRGDVLLRLRRHRP